MEETVFAVNGVADLNAKDGIPLGEAKVLFSDAESGESYRIDFMASLNFCRITTAGTLSVGTAFQMIRNVEIPIKIEVRNNFLSIWANGLLLIPKYQFGKTSNGKVGLGTYLAKVTFSKFNIRALESRKCFVVMRYDVQRDFLYELVIRKVLMQHPIYEFEVERSDKLSTTGRVSREIMEKIQQADLVVADISAENKNVFDELGLAHAWDQNVILLRDSTEHTEIPFDLRDFRYFPYDYSPPGFELLTRRFEEIVTTTLKGKAAKHHESTS